MSEIASSGGEAREALEDRRANSSNKLSGGSGVGAVLDPGALSGLPEAVVTGIREGLSSAIHPVFWAGVPIVAVAFILTLFIEEIPLKAVAPMDEHRERPDEEPRGDVPEGSERKLAPVNMASGPVASAGLRQTAPVGMDGDHFIVTGLALAQLAHRIESANGDAPDLLLAASSLAPEDGSSEKERARAAADHVIRPPAHRMLMVAASSTVKVG